MAAFQAKDTIRNLKKTNDTYQNSKQRAAINDYNTQKGLTTVIFRLCICLTGIWLMVC